MADAVELLQAGNAVHLRLRVKPGGRRTQLLAAHGGALKLVVQAAPERGKANAAVVKLLAAQLGVARTAVEIIAGTSSQDKVAAVHGLGPAELAARLHKHGIAAVVPGPQGDQS